MKTLTLAALGACCMLFSLQAHATSPNEFIQEAVDLLTQKLDGREEELAEDSEALYSLIDEILLPRFDRRYAAGQVLARHWRGASAEQRERFVDAFYTTLLHRYADALLEFDNNRVEILPYRGDEEKKITFVKTMVRLEDGTKVPVSYALVKRNDGWQMFDVTVEGVSYVRNFRAEFDAEIRSTSIEQVIARLEEEAAGSVSGSGDGGESGNSSE